MGMRKDTVVDRETLKKNNSIKENVARELYKEQQFFPHEALLVLNRCVWHIMGEATQSTFTQVQEGEEYVINLHLRMIKDLDELVECMFHELAHVYLNHFNVRMTPSLAAKQELEAEKQTTKWFNEYYFRKNS